MHISNFSASFIEKSVENLKLAKQKPPSSQQLITFG
jgi:hypothetical protein